MGVVFLLLRAVMTTPEAMPANAEPFEYLLAF